MQQNPGAQWSQQCHVLIWSTKSYGTAVPVIRHPERVKQKKYSAVPSASASQKNLSEVEMVNDAVDDIIHDVREGDNSKDHQHTAQSSIIYLGGSGSKYSSNPSSNIGAGHAPNWTRSRSRPYQSEKNRSAPPEGGNRGQEQGDSSDRMWVVMMATRTSPQERLLEEELTMPSQKMQIILTDRQKPMTWLSWWPWNWSRKSTTSCCIRRLLGHPVSRLYPIFSGIALVE